MTILSFLFQKQTHKAQRGYYINHDNLLAGTDCTNCSFRVRQKTADLLLYCGADPRKTNQSR